MAVGTKSERRSSIRNFINKLRKTPSKKAVEKEEIIDASASKVCLAQAIGNKQLHAKRMSFVQEEIVSLATDEKKTSMTAKRLAFAFVWSILGYLLYLVNYSSMGKVEEVVEEPLVSESNLRSLVVVAVGTAFSLFLFVRLQSAFAKEVVVVEEEEAEEVAVDSPQRSCFKKSA